mmetsp:Transcript_38514/g.81028  ORF Transcript_38514/g.81028 Transcript_38514/m.81028 type:complete len:240 (+) Transcript_38514:968-1687(+)
MTPSHGLGIVLTSRIIVQHVDAMGSVDVVTVGPEPRGAVEFLTVEYAGRVRIHGNLQLGMTLAKTQSGAPYRIRQFRLGQIVRAFCGGGSHLTREGDHAQMRHFVIAIEVHAQLINVRDIGTQHGVFILGHVPHLHHFFIPVRFEVHVRIGGHAEVLGTEGILFVRLSNVLSEKTPRVGWSGGILGVNGVDKDLIFVRTIVSRRAALGGVPPSGFHAQFSHHVAVFVQASGILAGNVLL